MLRLSNNDLIHPPLDISLCRTPFGMEGWNLGNTAMVTLIGRPFVVAAFFFFCNDTEQSPVGSNGLEHDGRFPVDLDDGKSLPSNFLSASVGWANRSAAATTGDVEVVNSAHTFTK